MKPRLGAPLVRMSPSPDGWRAQTSGDSCTGTTLTELCGKLPSGLKAELLLPSSALVTELLNLPVAPREDLLSMAQLQLEKLLPYTADDFVFDIEELAVSGENAQVLAITVPLNELKNCALPLRGAFLGPVSVGVYALQLARSIDLPGISLVIWLEEGKPYILLAREGRLLWIDGLPSEGEVAVPNAAEIQRAVLGAELSGVLSGPVERVYLPPEGWGEVVRQAIPGIVIEARQLEPALELAGSWLPPAWAAEAAALVRKSLLFERLQWIAIGYAALLAAGFCWLAFEKSRVGKLDGQIAELQPQVELLKARQNRWKTLEPALEPSRYLIELLHQAAKTVGGADIRITEFQMNPKEFAFSAEASNVAEAIEYVGRLKKEQELSSFKIESANPNILPNERAQFRVTGKVDAALAKR